MANRERAKNFNSLNDKSASFSALIYGHVQGVGFRYRVHRHARALSLCGWVRNNPDRTVTVVCYGENPDIDEMKHWLQRWHGVSRVEFSPCTEMGYHDFRILY